MYSGARAIGRLVHVPSKGWVWCVDCVLTVCVVVNSDMLFEEQKSASRGGDDDLHVLGEKLGDAAEKVSLSCFVLLYPTPPCSNHFACSDEIEGSRLFLGYALPL